MYEIISKERFDLIKVIACEGQRLYIAESFNGDKLHILLTNKNWDEDEYDIDIVRQIANTYWKDYDETKFVTRIK